MSNNNLGLYIGLGVGGAVLLGGGGYYLASSNSRQRQPSSDSNNYSDDYYSQLARQPSAEIFKSAYPRTGGKRKRKITLKRRGKK